MKRLNRRDFFAPWRLLRSPANYLRPPGATALLGRVSCEDCTACADACPEEAIQMLENGTPAIFPEIRACALCADLPCVQACAISALRPIPIEQIQMGKATIDEVRCWSKLGQPCDYCEHACPLQAIRNAEVDPSRCVGCGACVYICTATPAAVTIQ